MKETANQGYPYPECDPPFVKDAGDLPLQLKALAEAVDDDVTALQAQAAGALNPPSASLSANPSTYDPLTNRFILNTVNYDNAAMASAVTSGMTAPSDGLYYITAVRLYSQSAAAGTQLAIQVNGAIVETSSINPSAAAVATQNTVTSVQFLAAGDLVTLIGIEQNNALDGSAFLQMFRIAVA